MAWKLECTGDEGNFLILLDTSAKTWRAEGGSVAAYFTTRSGSTRIVVMPERGTRLEKTGGPEVGFLRGLDGTTAVGTISGGNRSETAELFTWKLNSKG